MGPSRCHLGFLPLDFAQGFLAQKLLSLWHVLKTRNFSTVFLHTASLIVLLSRSSTLSLFFFFPVGWFFSPLCGSVFFRIKEKFWTLFWLSLISSMEISLYSHESYFFHKFFSLCSVDKRCRQQPASIPKHNCLSGCPSSSKPLFFVPWKWLHV